MLGIYPQAAAKNRRHPADRDHVGRSRLVPDVNGATVAAVGDIRLRVPATHHLFRTPSLRGWDRASLPVLPAFFLLPVRAVLARAARQKPALSAARPAWRLAGSGPIRLYPSWNRMPALRVVLVGMFLNKGAGSCVSSKSERFLPPWPLSRPAATQWGNRLSSAPVQVRRRLPFWTATFLRAQPSVPPATRCIARAAPAGSADHARNRNRLTLPRAGGNDIFSSNEAASGRGAGCGFSRFFQIQPKDDPCSRRS
ncbi:hypothetical protein SAMN05421849_1152 [Pontibaca methylaminivorans]|uniref:Uncharacterized protein n=1 Tax=Pontibaca methylaminivorans TaxID=515897 RepID=A0A1R3WNL4_9RHOB|nr:hypothetical protein SAMN05421849_1152 [Pontibaca methylaminivorans]